MINSILSLLILTTFTSPDEDIHKLVLDWNSATISSISVLYKKSTNTSEIALLDNFRTAFRVMYDMDKPISDTNIIRGSFMDRVQKEDVFKYRNWIVIEELKTGAVSQRVNYLFLNIGADRYRVIKYRDKYIKWAKLGEIIVSIKRSEFEDTVLRRPYASVLASHKIILTRFSFRKLKRCSFYLQTTFSDQSKLSQVITEAYASGF